MLLMMANKPQTAVQSSASFFSWHQMVYCYMCMRWQDMGAWWLHCRGMPTFWIRVLARYWQHLVGMNLISSEPQALRLRKALWGWISLVQIHKCCAQLCLYKLVMPEGEVAVCFADEGQQARNSCPEFHFFFSLGTTWSIFTCESLHIPVMCTVPFDIGFRCLYMSKGAW